MLHFVGYNTPLDYLQNPVYPLRSNHRFLSECLSDYSLPSHFLLPDQLDLDLFPDNQLQFDSDEKRLLVSILRYAFSSSIIVTQKLYFRSRLISLFPDENVSNPDLFITIYLSHYFYRNIFCIFQKLKFGIVFV